MDKGSGVAARIARAHRATSSLAILCAATFVLTGCRTDVPPTGAPSPSPTALLELPVATYATLADVGCDSIGVKDPVVGILQGDVSDKVVVWLLDADGQRIEVVWPEGFVARYEPMATLYDAAGTRVAGAGQGIYLQVSRGSADGTTVDPYFATGLLAAGAATVDPDDPTAGASYVGCFGRKD